MKHCCHGNSQSMTSYDKMRNPVHSEFRNIVMSLVATLWNVYICIREWKPHHHEVVSWEPEGRCQYSKMFSWELEGRYRCTKSLAIAPFWFSTEHPWIVIVPFWLLTDQVVYSQLCLSRIRRSRRSLQILLSLFSIGFTPHQWNFLQVDAISSVTRDST